MKEYLYCEDCGCIAPQPELNYSVIAVGKRVCRECFNQYKRGVGTSGALKSVPWLKGYAK